MKKILRCLFLMCLGFILFGSSVYAEEYDFIIGNNKLNAENSTITDGDDGRAIWNSKEKTLYLENFDFEGLGTFVEMDVEGLSGIYTIFGSEDPGDIKVTVKGKNTFKYSDDAFTGTEEDIIEMVGCFFGNVTFEGNGEIDFISSNNDEVAIISGLMAFNDLTIIDTKIKVVSYKALSESIGITASSKLNAQDSTIIIDIKENELSYGITSHEINLDSTYLEVNLQDGTALMGIEDNTTNITNSIIKINVGATTEFGYGIESEDLLTLKNSKLIVDTDQRGIVTDVFKANNSSMTIAAKGGVLARGGEFDFSSYLDNNYEIVLNASTTPSPDGNIIFVDQNNLSMYQYLNVIIPAINGGVKYNLQLPNIQVGTDNMANFYNQTEVDKLKIGYNSDILFSLNISDEYNIYDTDIVNKNLGKYTLGKILDISLLKKIGNGRDIKIANLNDKIKIIYQLDDELAANNREYAVLRVHNGKAELLKAEYDSVNKRLIFDTDMFSTYAILYKTFEPNPDTGDNIMFYIIMGTVSLIGLGSVLYLYKKKRVF